MNGLAVLRALLSLASSLTTYLQNKQILEAGEAKAVSEGLKNAQNAITKAHKTRYNANRAFDERDGVPDDQDPNLRD